VHDFLDAFSPTVLIEGGCYTGADFFARTWAERNEVAHIRCNADWSRFGRAAGPIRNREMLEQQLPDLILAFGRGRGTDNLVKLAKRFQYGDHEWTVVEVDR
jgi:hypothetical protein